MPPASSSSSLWFPPCASPPGSPSTRTVPLPRPPSRAVPKALCPVSALASSPPDDLGRRPHSSRRDSPGGPWPLKHTMSVALSTAAGACPHTGDSATSRAGPCFPGSQPLRVLDQAVSGLSVATAQSQPLLLASHTRSVGSLPSVHAQICTLLLRFSPEHQSRRVLT